MGFGKIQLLVEYWPEGFNSSLTIAQTSPSISCHVDDSMYSLFLNSTKEIESTKRMKL